MLIWNYVVYWAFIPLFLRDTTYTGQRDVHTNQNRSKSKNIIEKLFFFLTFKGGMLNKSDYKANSPKSDLLSSSTSTITVFIILESS